MAGNAGGGHGVSVGSWVACFVIIAGFVVGGIAMIIWNKDWENWKEALPVEEQENTPQKYKGLNPPRPGHADLAGPIAGCSRHQSGQDQEGQSTLDSCFLA